MGQGSLRLDVLLEACELNSGERPRCLALGCFVLQEKPALTSAGCSSFCLLKRTLVSRSLQVLLGQILKLA